MSKTTSKLHRCIKIHRVVRLHAHDDNSAPSRIYQGATYLTMQAKMTKQSKANGNVYVYIFVHEQMSMTAAKKKEEKKKGGGQQEGSRQAERVHRPHAVSANHHNNSMTLPCDA